MSATRFATATTDRLPPLMRPLLAPGLRWPFGALIAWLAILLAIVFGAVGIDDLIHWHRQAQFLPLEKDYASLYHVWMIAYLWSRSGAYFNLVSVCMSSLVRNGAASKPRRSVTDRVARINAVLQSRWTHTVVLLLSLITCTAGTVYYTKRGAYGPSADGNPLHITHYSETWAAFPHVGFFVFVLVSSFGAYLIYWIAFVTVVVGGVWFLSRRELRLRLAIRCADGRWGWANAASLIDVGGRILTASILGLAAVAWRGGFSQPQYFAFFPLACLAGVLPYIYSNRIWRDALEAPARPADELDPALRAMVYAVAPKNLASARAALYQVLFIILPAVVAITGYLSRGH
jgi:hypothetical protein